MPKRSEEVLVPKNGHTLMVAIGCRISGCADQKEASLDDQEDNAKETVAKLYEGRVHFDVISTTAKGERLDRPELAQFKAAYRSGIYDLVIFDDLGRLVRGGEGARLLGIGVDNDTRTICINDGIDTAAPTWEEDALNACGENVAHNERTSRRIKQKSMNRFKKFGGAPGRPIAGYVVPPGAKTYDEWQKEESATATIKEAVRRLLTAERPNCTAVADWLNSVKFPVGPYCRGKEWYGGMVRKYFGNTLLCGRPRRGAKHSVKIHETGRRVSQTNPKGPTYYEAPHLAHLDEHTFESLQIKLAAANAHYQRPRVNGAGPMRSVSAKRSRYPGRSCTCGYCGRPYVWGGNGITDHVMCSGSRERRCWNSIGFDGKLAAAKLVVEITSSLYKLGQFDQQFSDMVAAARLQGKDSLPARWDDWRRRSAQHEKAKQNVRDSISELGLRPLLKEELDRIEEDERKLARERHELEFQGQQQLVLPDSVPMLRELMQAEFTRLAVDSFDCADLLKQIVSEFQVYLVRLCDGGHLFPRARIKLNLAGTFPDIGLVPELQTLVTREFTLDLDIPPQRERIRLEAVRLAADGNLTYMQIADQIAEKPSSTAVGKAIKLHRRMLELGLESPWIIQHEPPSDYPKLRRHKNLKYRFEPVEGYERRPL